MTFCISLMTEWFAPTRVWMPNTTSIPTCRCWLALNTNTGKTIPIIKRIGPEKWGMVITIISASPYASSSPINGSMRISVPIWSGAPNLGSPKDVMRTSVLAQQLKLADASVYRTTAIFVWASKTKSASIASPIKHLTKRRSIGHANRSSTLCFRWDMSITFKTTRL